MRRYLLGKGRVDIYTIPPNFAEEGTLFSGRVRTRNAVETVILVFFLLQALLALDWEMKAKIYAGVIVLIPGTIFSILGVQGESLSSFVFHFFCYLKKRRLLTEPDGRDRLNRNRRLRKMEKRKKKRRSGKGGAGYKQRSQGTETKTKRSKNAGKARPEGRKKKPENGTERRQEKGAGRKPPEKRNASGRKSGKEGDPAA